MGKVILIGAGPGDPELITVRAWRYLKEADVVITDRLVSPELLKEVKASASIIPVGKQGRNDASFSQQAINDLLIEKALHHKLVVRLKGGDVSYFSNILDELATLSEHKVLFEIVPGITAASGAAAYAGIPLTARDHATAVRFLTYYDVDLLDEGAWRDLALTDDTLVFYMSSNRSLLLAEKLTYYDISSDKGLAVIEQATTPNQRVRVYNLYTYVAEKVKEKYVSPTILIVGKVTQLHEKFKWFVPSSEEENYFKALPAQKKENGGIWYV